MKKIDMEYLVYYCCVLLAAFIMLNSGYTIIKPEFWCVVICVTTAKNCGVIIQKNKEKNIEY